MAVRLFESLRAVFYTPYYLALELGAYAEHGLDVALDRPPEPGQAATSLFGGPADVTWGGPMRMLQYLDGHGPGTLVGFAEAVCRDPFFLVGQRPNPTFHPRDLREARLATVSEVPTPWLCLGEDIRRSGVDPDSLDRVADRTMAENVAALRAGTVDVVQVFEPFVETLVAEGAGHVWYAAASRGLTTYTTLYTSRGFAAANPSVLDGLAAGVLTAERWLHAHDAAAIAERVAPYFPDVPGERLAGAIRRYLELGVWSADPRGTAVGFVRLKSALLAGGFISRDVPFDECFDNGPAERALAAAG